MDLLIALILLAVPATLAVRRRHVWPPHTPDHLLLLERMRDDLQRFADDLWGSLRPSLEVSLTAYHDLWHTLTDPQRAYIGDQP